MAIETAFFTKYYKALRPEFIPMKWMERMFLRLIKGDSPSLVDLPTGSGKTELIVVWLIALAWYSKNRETASSLPRRLVWVVNRRVLVQQVYDVALRLVKCFDELTGPAKDLVSILRSLCGQNSKSVFNVIQLRGQRLDDREWSLDPTVPQLIIGTVDQIGSRVLFQGYGLGKWSRPMHAGLLGVDAWICVDEAHLVPSFAVTLRQVREIACHPLAVSVPDPIEQFFSKLPFWITELSATPGLPLPRHGNMFALKSEDENDPIVADRLLAKRTRRVLWKPQPEKKYVARDIAATALKFASGNPGSAIAVFCCLVKDANLIAKEIQRQLKGRALLVTGRIRGFERDRLESNDLFQRFRNGHPEPPTDDKPTFLIGTAAAEVGLDADASAIVCDFASLPTLVQRLGRLDRRGQLSNRASESQLPPPTMTIIGGSDGKTTSAQLNALAAKLKTTQSENDSEYAADFFVGTAWSVVVGKEKAEKDEDDLTEQTPEIQVPDLKDEVASEIATGAKHGVDDALTSATWRVIGLPSAESKYDGKEGDSNEPVQPLEQRTTDGEKELQIETRKPAADFQETYQSAAWLCNSLAGITAGPVIVPPLTDTVLQRWAATTPHSPKFLPVHPWLYGLLPDEEGTPLIGIAFRLEIDILEHMSDVDEDDAETDRTWEKVCRCLESFPPLNSELHFVPIGEAREWLDTLPPQFQTAMAHFDGDSWSNTIQSDDLTPNSVLVLPTSFPASALDKIILKGGDESDSQRCWDVFEALAQDGAKYRRVLKTNSIRLRPDPVNAKGTYCVPDCNTEESRSEFASEEIVDSVEELVLGLDVSKWKSARIELKFAKGGINFSLRYYKPNYSGSTDLELLSDHLDTAADHGRHLARALAPDNAWMEALLSRTARDHDIGKDQQKWQQAMGNTPTWRKMNGHPVSILVAKPVIENPSNKVGYRHEWGTFLKVNAATNLILNDADPTQEAFMRDLYLHLILAHHGYFRPSMPERGFDAKKTSQQNQLRFESIERFARLQKQLGYWRLAYLESLVKIADVTASRDAEVQEVDDES